MLTQFLLWYLVVLLIHVAALPLAARLFGALPDRGYALARPLGILLTGYLFWLGYSLGLVRSEAGGAWLALLAFAALSVALGRGEIAQWRRGGRRFDRWGVVFTELFFLVAFAAWAAVRAHDPAADHTEEPMDLMFMNSIWFSPTYPPQDAWLAGFPISYYYFGYWLLTTLGRLAGQPPEIAYTLGQATWWALLLTGSYAIVYNLLARLPQYPIPNNQSPIPASESPISNLDSPPTDTSRAPVLGGLLAALSVGVAGNVQTIIEWLYALGAPVGRLGAWFGVAGFPENAQVTRHWYVQLGSWWWWRSSRVIEDFDLLGRHVEVIDEFPAFSYVLGDNHPHVVAMPIVLLAIGLALALWFGGPRTGRRFAFLPWDAAEALVVTAVLGSLLFLNTWDFPPYWLLPAVVWFTLQRRAGAPFGRALGHALGMGGVLLGGALLLYAPYLLTAQSQAQGIEPNLFNPTRLRQFLLMFGPALLAVGALLWPAWRERRPSWAGLAAWVGVTVGFPVLFLALSAAVAVNTEFGRGRLAGRELPEGAGGYLPFILDRWTASPWTLLLTTGLAGLALALWWARAQPEDGDHAPADAPPAFALMLAALGLLLVAAPEFIYLRDSFGTRMNTVFKFYYQGWLLFGLSGAFAITRALQAAFRRAEGGGRSLAPAALALPALALILAGAIFLPAAAYSKTGGLGGAATFDATAYMRDFAPAELAAARWLRDNAPPGARVAEAKGDSYHPELSRISTVSGRPTLLGWEFHQRQWRGDAYGAMAQGRPEALDRIYRTAAGEELRAALDAWNVDFVVVGPAERAAYGATPQREEEMGRVLPLVFEDGDVRIYQRP